MRKIILFTALFALLLVGCNTKKEDEMGVELTGISLNRKTLSLEVGSSSTLLVIYQPDEAADYAPAVTWESSTPRVATVDKNGRVTALQKGETVISAYCGKFFADCKVEVENAGAVTPPEEDKFKVSPTVINDDGKGGTYTLDVTSNIAWTAACEQTWATISPASGEKGEKVTVTVEANPEETADAQTITFTAGLFTQTVTVNRAGVKQIKPLSIDIKEKEIPVKGGSFDVKVTCAVAWEVKCENANVHFSNKTDEGVTISVDLEKSKIYNTEGNIKIPVVFSNEDVSDTLVILQARAFADLQPNQFMTWKGLSYTCQMKSNISWQLKFTYTATDSEHAKNYMTANPSFGNGDGVVSVTMNKVHGSATYMSGDGYVFVVGTGNWSGLEKPCGNTFYNSDDFK